MAKRPNTGEKLTDELRRTIVMRLAMFDDVAAIRADLAEMGIEISKQAIGHYNPETTTARIVSKQWVDLFHATREAWLKEISAEPIANRAYRLRRLEEVRRLAIRDGDYKEANKALEQAAKEIGQVYSNVQVHKGIPSGTSVQTDAMSEDERRNMLADRIRDALEKVKAQRGVTVQ